MKKFFGLYAAAFAALFASCDKTGNSYDFAQILYPSSYGATIYADQQRDTLTFATTYDWTLGCSDNWVSIAPDSMSGTVPNGYYMVNKVWVKFDANTTDTSRVAVVSFNADGKSLAAIYGQLHYLNITRPERRQYQFQLTDTATQLRDSIMFRTYSDDWTLSFKGEQPSWVRFADDAVTTGRAGAYKVFCELEPNTSENERVAWVELKSRGVATDIKIRQEGVVKKE